MSDFTSSTPMPSLKQPCKPEICSRVLWHRILVEVGQAPSGTGSGGRFQRLLDLHSYNVIITRCQMDSCNSCTLTAPMLFGVMAKQTAFRSWREQMGFTQDEAAEALGVTKSQVANWDAGKVRGTKRGEPSVPPLSVRRIMTALDIGQLPEPWPE